MMAWRSSKFLLLVIATLTIPQSDAIAEDSRPFLGGAGAVPCEKWLDARKEKFSVLEFGLESWVLGFVSGSNLVVDEQAGFLAGIAKEDILNRLDNHCRAHPSDPLISATLLIIGDLMKARADQIRKNSK
jgi:hypothetical protein